MGGGGVVYEDLVKMNGGCGENRMVKNGEVVCGLCYGKEKGKSVEFMGVSCKGGVER